MCLFVNPRDITNVSFLNHFPPADPGSLSQPLTQHLVLGWETLGIAFRFSGTCNLDCHKLLPILFSRLVFIILHLNIPRGSSDSKGVKVLNTKLILIYT